MPVLHKNNRTFRDEKIGKNILLRLKFSTLWHNLSPVFQAREFNMYKEIKNFLQLLDTIVYFI